VLPPGDLDSLDVPGRFTRSPELPSSHVKADSLPRECRYRFQGVIALQGSTVDADHTALAPEKGLTVPVMRPQIKAATRRLLVGISAVLGAAAMLVTSAALPAGRWTTTSASADACPSIQVVFARGTGEPPGVGRVGQAFVDALQPLVEAPSVGVYGVNYPASYDFMRATEGADDASTFVENIAATCPNTKIVLGGYSQGAAVIDLITAPSRAFLGFAQPMPPDVAPHVAAVAVFGNPANRIGGPLSAVSPLYGDKTIDLCNGGDPVCSDGNDAGAHRVYVEDGMASRAVAFVAQRLSAPSPGGAPNSPATVASVTSMHQ
jgi:cutinase